MKYRMQGGKELAGWVETAADPDQPLPMRHRAFTNLVTEFQDMAFGSAFALMGDYAAAEDAAQDAFVAAWQNLNHLRDTRTFPGWLQKVVASQCHRRLRRKRLPIVLLEDVIALPSAVTDDPQEQIQKHAEAARVHAAIRSLPETERQVTVLFYIADHSQAEIAAFTGLSIVGVRKRLASARRRLQERMQQEMKEELESVRPSQDTAFTTRVIAFSKLFSALVTKGVSLMRSFEQLAAQETSPEFRRVIEDISREVQAGNCLSHAMTKHPKYFSETYVSAIREGELKGVLEVVLDRLASGTYVLGTIPSPSHQANIAAENERILVHLAGHEQTEPEHALLGLLMCGENQSLHYLKSIRVGAWKLKWELHQHLADLPKGLPYQGASSSLREVHRIEAMEAEKNETIVVETLYLLLGLTTVENTLASRLLREAGVTTEGIRAYIAGERVTETAVKATD